MSYLDGNRGVHGDYQAGLRPVQTIRLNDDLTSLLETGVKPSDHAIEATFPNLQAAQPTQDLATVLRPVTKHFHAVAAGSSESGFGEKVQKRLQQDPKAAKRLKAAMHFGVDSCTSKEGRLITRQAIAVAFGKGASYDSINAIRDYCEFNLLKDRMNVLAQLNAPATDPDALIIKLQSNPGYRDAYAAATGIVLPDER